MSTKFLIAGFGGQGVILVGQLLGLAATAAGRRATFYPSYGPEQRGGTANCSVVISDEEIGSPLVTRPDALVCFNAAALNKFLPQLRPGGQLFINSSLIPSEEVERKDIELISLPINSLAAELGSDKVANIIMFGALVSRTGSVPLEYAEKIMLEKMARKPELLELNKKALLRGAQA